jgi:hypothetical protein
LVVTLTALVLAFSLVQAQANFRNTEAILTREASTLDLIQRGLQHIDSEAAADLRARLIAYGHAVIAEEWPLLAHGKHSRRLDAAYAELLRAANSIEPTKSQQQSAYNDVVKNLDLLAYLRSERITAAKVRLPSAFWHAIAAMILVSILAAAGIPTTLHHRLCTLLMSAALAVLVALVAIIDVPFQGQTAVRPTDLQQVLSQLDPEGGVPR